MDKHNVYSLIRTLQMHNNSYDPFANRQITQMGQDQSVHCRLIAPNIGLSKFALPLME